MTKNRHKNIFKYLNINKLKKLGRRGGFCLTTQYIVYILISDTRYSCHGF